MPKIKLTHKSPRIDMTPMVDLFSVVLIFLMLTTNFRISEPSAVDTPYSVSEKNIADFNKMTIVIIVFFLENIFILTILHYLIRHQNYSFHNIRWHQPPMEHQFPNKDFY